MTRKAMGLSNIRRIVRQHRFPAEFRIPAPDRYSVRPGDQLETLPMPVVTDPEPAPAVVAGLDDAVVADVATGVWRVLKRFAADSEAAKAQRLATRNLTAVAERLADAQVRIQDHDGAVFDPGLSLRVMAYEARAGIDRELVVETVRPSVYRSGRCIQTGQVIVGMPEKGQPA